MKEYTCIILITDHTNTLDISIPENKCYFEFKNSWRKYMNKYDDVLSLFICMNHLTKALYVIIIIII
jgi:hypothetical protein